jgi:hypothetical protein
MAITKRVEIDRIEVVGASRHIQIRTATIIEEDGEELSRSFFRHVVSPGDDTSEEDIRVRNIAAIEHTDEIIAAYKEGQE